MQVSNAPLTAISPIDGRYHQQTKVLENYFSEYALIKYRLQVEVLYFLELAQAGFFNLSQLQQNSISGILKNFGTEEAHQIKKIEKTTNHDIKALEYFLKTELDKLGLGDLKEWVHFALTSQDINNTAIPMLWKDAIYQQFIPQLEQVITQLNAMAATWQQIPMLAHTHGQPASPTAVGKEIKVFAYRLEKQLSQLKSLITSGKFGGATGNFNAHFAAFLDFNWEGFADNFLKNKLGIERQQFTTQIENYDDLAAQMNCLSRINSILVDLCRDFWQYISMNYFTQKTVAGEVGSSAMPHKVNPIDFENAEGNLGVSSALYIFMANKLPVSRLQRDLTDSTVLRNLGVPFAHCFVALKSILKGLQKVEVNKMQIDADLEQNWMVVAEAIQTILRKEGYPQPYEALKNLTRGKAKIDQKTVYNFIESLPIDENIRAQLKAVTPYNYVGNATQFS